MRSLPTLAVLAALPVALLAVPRGSAAAQAPPDVAPPDMAPPDGSRHVFRRALMGTEFRIVVHAADPGAARAAAERAFRRVAELERVLSDYDPASELSRLSAAAGTGRRVPVSGDLWAVLARAEEWSERTDGAFDVTVGALPRLWRRAARRGTVPSDEAIAAARQAVGHELLELDPSGRSVLLRAPGMRLDAGGIGKGYAADAALEVLAEAGFPAALVDAGGDVVAGGPPPGAAGWRVALPSSGGASAREAAAEPAADFPCVLLLADAALATSGDRYRSVEVGGVGHSHILDPRTGAALTHGRTVTVRAPTATEADVLASALSVLEPDEGRALLDRLPGTTDPVGVDLIPHSCPGPP